MKIISKHSDYYDSAAAYGVSDQYWKRQNEVSHHRNVELEEILKDASDWGGTPTIVMFCGRAYGVIQMKRGNYPPEIFLVTKEEDFETYRRMYEADRIARGTIYTAWPRLDPDGRYYCSDRSYSKRGFQAFLNDIAELNCERYHRDYNAPIISITRTYIDGQSNYEDARGRCRRKVTIETNPSLKALGFQKVKDAFSAYQEIDSYLSGVLGVSANPTVQISDVHRLEGHGFDKRTSFRNMKR